MQTISLHNPDRYMADLRQILSQGRKRIGIFIGAGAPTAIHVDQNNNIVGEGRPLVPDVAGLTDAVVSEITEDDRKVVNILMDEIEEDINIESILTRVRRLSQAIGKSTVHGLDSTAYRELGQRICKEIGRKVCSTLPEGPNPYSELVSWIAGTHRKHSVEIFTPNYDLLLEEAFERARVAYFDGFTGSHAPFFDPASVSLDEFPARWSRLWKLHGSLGWRISHDTVIRTGEREATELIYPDHLKYDQVTRLPYSALFERLRQFLTPDYSWNMLIRASDPAFSCGRSPVSLEPLSIRLNRLRNRTIEPVINRLPARGTVTRRQVDFPARNSHRFGPFHGPDASSVHYPGAQDTRASLCHNRFQSRAISR